jgi:hypothetical protein
MMKANKLMKRTCLSAIAALTLFVGAPAAQAASISFSGPTQVNVVAQNQFTVDVFIDDIAPLDNIMAWGLGFETTNAQITGISGKTDGNYVFFGNSFDFGGVSQNPTHYVAADLTNDGSGVAAAGAAGSLLCRLTVDVSNTAVGDAISIDLFGPGVWTMFLDADGNMETDITGGPYTAAAVPVPGAVWLLGSGLCGLIGWRKKSKKA